MKIISFISESLVIRRILEHLNLWRDTIPTGLPPPESTIPDDSASYELFDDGWGGYEEPSITWH